MQFVRSILSSIKARNPAKTVEKRERSVPLRELPKADLAKVSGGGGDPTAVPGKNW